jgi:tetratricopeptide (TPR) repeat protein
MFSIARGRLAARPLGLVASAVALVLISRVVTGATTALPAQPSTAAPLSPGSTIATPTRVPAVAPPDGLAATGPDSLGRIDQAIGVWTANLRDDRADFLSATQLGLDYYQRARIGGDVEDDVRAEAAISAALTAYPDYPPADEIESVLRYTTHDFGAALGLADHLLGRDPRDVAALATRGDAELELGEYANAGSDFQALQTSSPGAATTARLAHLAWLRGDSLGADRLADAAAAEARSAGIGGPSLSWYDYLVGYLAFQNGELDRSAAAYGQALSDWPGSYLALSGFAKTRAAQGRFDEAIDLEKRAIAIVPQPQVLADLGDLYALTGHPDLAAQQYATVRAIANLAAIQRQVYNRALVMFDVNHQEHLDEALTLATAELAVRKDIYGWDAYAWALLANGRPADAAVAMVHATALGTRDPLLAYHAGMIALANHQTGQARTLLQEALSVNAGFDLLQAQRALKALQALQ